MNESAAFAAGCFRGGELGVRRIPGVKSGIVRYTGGHKAESTYQEVCTGTTGHPEAAELED